MFDNIFWLVTWALTVAICLWKLTEAVVFRPAQMLEWPFLACAMWLYFYGIMAYQAKTTLSAYLGHGMENLGQLMPLLCLIGLLAGWSVGKRIPVKREVRTTEISYGLCWCAGFFFLLVAAAGSYSVAHSQEEGTLNYSQSSAYWYLIFYVGYPGLAIALWAGIKIKSPYRYALWGLSAVGLLAFMMPHLLTARRGPLFPAIIVLLLVPPLTLRRPPSRVIYCGGLAALGLVMLLFLQIRQTTYNGGTWSEAFQKLDVSSAVVDRGEDAYDNEYVLNCQVIGTVYQNGTYEYGTNQLELLVHWVPRALWPNKPGLGQGIYGSRLYDDMEQATGVRLLGNGAAAAGVADSFLQYGIFCPIWWFVASCALGAVYAKVLYSRSPWWMFSYVGFLCASHWLVSQAFAAAFVPCMFFEAVPFIVFWVLSSLYQRERAARPRGRSLARIPASKPALP